MCRETTCKMAGASLVTQVKCTQGHVWWPSVALEATPCGTCGVEIAVSAQMVSCEVCFFDECTSCAAATARLSMSGVRSIYTASSDDQVKSEEFEAVKPTWRTSDWVEDPVVDVAADAQHDAAGPVVDVAAPAPEIAVSASSGRKRVKTADAPVATKHIVQPASAGRKRVRTRATPESASQPPCSCLGIQEDSFCFCSSVSSSGRKQALTRAMTSSPSQECIPASIPSASSPVSLNASSGRKRVLTRTLSSTPPLPPSQELHPYLRPANASAGRKRVLSRSSSSPPSPTNPFFFPSAVAQPAPAEDIDAIERELRELQEKFKAGLVSGELGNSVEGRGNDEQAGVCTTRPAIVGDIVARLDGPKYTSSEGWTLEENGVAVVAEISKHGDFKLRNSEGNVTDTFKMRDQYKYIEAVACTKRPATIGDKVVRTDGLKYASREGWTLEEGGIAVIVDVDNHGDFKLRNSEGKITATYKMPEAYKYMESVASVPCPPSTVAPLADISKRGQKRVLTRTVSDAPSQEPITTTNGMAGRKRVLSRQMSCRTDSALETPSPQPLCSSTPGADASSRKPVRVLSRTITPEALSTNWESESPRKSARTRGPSPSLLIAEAVPKSQDGIQPGDRKTIRNPPGSPHVNGLEVEFVEFDHQAGRWKCRVVRSW